MRVIVAYDGSRFADEALDDLPRAGLPRDVQAVVVTAADVLSPPDNLKAPGSLESLQYEQHVQARVADALDQARSFADRAATRLRELFPSWTVSTHVVADSPAWAIIKHSEGDGTSARRADLIVLGAAGRSAVGRALFGSVALKVLNNTRCAVRVGRASGSTATGTPPRLVVGVDGSADSDAALRAICARSWPPGTECRAATVVDLQLLTTMPGMSPGALPAPQAPAQLIADKAVESLRKAGLAAAPVVREGAVAHSLVLLAEEWRADAIFVGARGLRRMERFLLGSVSSSVAMRAPCSVEVVHV